jgi:hypothetical protein
MEITAKAELNEFLTYAHSVGCKEDQLRHFLSGGYVPQPKQCVFHAAAREADLPGGPDEIGFGGSRGPGKSHSIFAQVALDDCQRAPGLKCLYLRKIGKQAKEQLEDLRLRVLFSIPHHYNRQEGVITFNQWGNSRILLGHFKDEKDIEAYLGLEYDLIAIEEASTLSASKYQALRDSNRTSKSNWRPRIYNSTNPGGVGHVFYKKRFIIPYRTGTEKYTRFIPATIDDNRFIDNDYRRKIEENTGWKLKAYRYGDFDIEAGQYFDSWNYMVHVCKPFQIPDYWVKFGAYDHGYHHPFGFGFFACNEDGEVWLYREIVDRGKRPDEIARMVWQYADAAKLQYIVAGHDCWATRDGGPDIAKQFKDLGQYSLTLKQANIDRKQGASQMRDYLAHENLIPGLRGPRLHIFDNCLHTIAQIPAMIRNPDDVEDVLKMDADDDDVDTGDDLYDMVRYGIMTRPPIAKVPQPEFKGYSNEVFQQQRVDNFLNKRRKQLAKRAKGEYNDPNLGKNF